MNRKVVSLVALVEDGYAIAGVDPARDGGLRMRLRRGEEREAFDFAFFEIPAILQATAVVGVCQ
ncbi:MAG TPA: hypothetical protein VGR28_04820 [Candidatus Thermoplasmatota archaeon]|jgi:hypothetical protein|nr:hypothetical protein [Candidatus Thermoplasmatota archaeon]